MTTPEDRLRWLALGLGTLLAAYLIAGGCGCGYSQEGNETVGYVKHVTNETPLLCPNHTDAEVDLRTPGTMVSERVRFTVDSARDATTLRAANVSGSQVKLTSRELRQRWCSQKDHITAVELLPGGKP
jgi:hypothetical protein